MPEIVSIKVEELDELQDFELHGFGICFFLQL
jgi:hypothetical protein